MVQTRFLSRSTREVPRTHRQNETREDLAASFACRMHSVTKGYRLGILITISIHTSIHYQDRGERKKYRLLCDCGKIIMSEAQPAASWGMDNILRRYVRESSKATLSVWSALLAGWLAGCCITTKSRSAARSPQARLGWVGLGWAG